MSSHRCNACGRRRPDSFLFRVPREVFVEGYPSGYWGRFEAGALLCTSHSLQDKAGDRLATERFDHLVASAKTAGARS